MDRAHYMPILVYSHPNTTHSDGDMMSVGTPTCFQDGKFVQLDHYDTEKEIYIQDWKNCDGRCIKPTKKCNGTCNSHHQCESNDGSCLNLYDNNSNWKSCKGKCIPKEDLCDGECVDPMCKQDGKCLSMFEFETEDELQVFKNCNGACMKATEKCEGKCEEYQCEDKM